MGNAIKRKEKTEKFCQARGIPINPMLSILDDENTAQLRDTSEIGKRTIILYVCILVANGEEKRELVIPWLKKENLWDALTPNELDYLGNTRTTKLTNDYFLWNGEAIFVLLWTLNKINELPFPIHKLEQGDIDTIVKSMPKLGESTSDFLNNLSIRDTGEILDEADKIMRFHWAAFHVLNNKKKKKIRNKLDITVIMKREHALNWIIKNDEAWDTVQTYSHKNYFEDLKKMSDAL